jgi:hypothetical protein
MAERVTRQQVEVLASGAGAARITQQYLEILSLPPVTFEVDASSTISMGQDIKVLAGDIYVTRQQVELASSGAGQLRVTQHHVEVLSRRTVPLDTSLTYATLADGEDYFTYRLHTKGWPSASPTDRQKALVWATKLIDTLNFKDHKHSVYTLLNEAGCGQNISVALDNECITQEELQAANLTQPLEFPRGADTDIPQSIKDACMEIAEALLDGKDAEQELENLSVFTTKAEGVSVSSDRRYIPIEHLVNLIPSAVAWSWIKPFLVDDEAIKLTRIT